MTTSTFRHHDTVPPRVSSPYYAQLIREWVDLNATPRIAAAVRAWGEREPALSGLHRPGDVVDAIDAAPPAREDEMLLALIRLTQGGDQLAGRIVLQAMLPKLGRLTNTTGPSSSDDAWIEDRRHIVVAHLWQVTAGYPTEQRTRKVAANLGLDTLHKVTEGTRRARPDVPVPPEVLGTLAAGVHDAVVLPGELPDSPDLADVLQWALERRALTRDQAALLARIYLGEGTTTQRSHDAAQALGITFRAVRDRTRIARGRLTAALEADRAISR